jgi:phosphoribosyl 1,2-cyclic phosphate phosphodiesterase
MKLQFLGTGASEGIPPVFGRSDFYRRVRDERGADLRTRTSFRLGEHYQIDFSPDHLWQSLRCGADLFDVRHLLITHTDNDHFRFEGVLARETAAETTDEPLHLYMSPPAAAWLEQIRDHLTPQKLRGPEARRELDARYPVHSLDYFTRTTVGDLVVETVKASHRGLGDDEWAINYLVTLPGGRTLLFASDTGYYPEESWAFLQGRPLDVLVLECTYGDRTDRGERPSGHLDCRSFLAMLDRFVSIGALGEHSLVYATHIGTVQGFDHAGLQQWFSESRYPQVRVAYDCLEIPDA